MKRVLIVDDALDLGRMLRTALETLNAGLDVRVLPSAEEALLDISRTPAALMVSDIRLPGMSGFELLKKVRSRSPETRFIMITGMTDEKLVKEAEEAGANRFMRKPIKVGEFLQIAQELLDLVDETPAPPIPIPPASPAVTITEQQLPEESISTLVTRLRRELGARQVLLADDHGRVRVQAGEGNDADFENRWAPAVMAALSAAARVAHLVHTGLPQAVLAFRGDPENVIIAPVGEYALVVYQRNDGSGLRTALTQEELFTAQQELARIMEAMDVRFYARGEVQRSAPFTAESSVPLAAAIESAAPADEAPNEELIHAFDGPQTKLTPSDADGFWEQAVSDTGSALSGDPDVLSYDQARQLGLTPDAE
jgi:CheY-like chemotaxis protein